MDGWMDGCHRADGDRQPFMLTSTPTANLEAQIKSSLHVFGLWVEAAAPGEKTVNNNNKNTNFEKLLISKVSFCKWFNTASAKSQILSNCIWLYCCAGVLLSDCILIPPLYEALGCVWNVGKHVIISSTEVQVNLNLSDLHLNDTVPVLVNIVLTVTRSTGLRTHCLSCLTGQITENWLTSQV